MGSDAGMDVRGRCIKSFRDQSSPRNLRCVAWAVIECKGLSDGGFSNLNLFSREYETWLKIGQAVKLIGVLTRSSPSQTRRSLSFQAFVAADSHKIQDSAPSLEEILLGISGSARTPSRWNFSQATRRPHPGPFHSRPPWQRGLARAGFGPFSRKLRQLKMHGKDASPRPRYDPIPVTLPEVENETAQRPEPRPNSDFAFLPTTGPVAIVITDCVRYLLPRRGLESSFSAPNVWCVVPPGRSLSAW